MADDGHGKSALVDLLEISDFSICLGTASPQMSGFTHIGHDGTVNGII